MKGLLRSKSCFTQEDARCREWSTCVGVEELRTSLRKWVAEAWEEMKDEFTSFNVVRGARVYTVP
jgi:hypothetical protein